MDGHFEKILSTLLNLSQTDLSASADAIYNEITLCQLGIKDIFASMNANRDKSPMPLHV